MALATIADSPQQIFFNQSVNGVVRCAKQKARVSSSASLVALGYVYAFSGGCTTANDRLPGHIGVYTYLIRGDGYTCSASGWSYNTVTTSQWDAVTSSGPCGHGYNYKSMVRGKLWRGDTGTYATAGFYTSSPYLGW